MTECANELVSSQGGQRGHALLKFLENTVILCFERRFFKQNSVIRLKSDSLAPKKFLGWLRHCLLLYNR